MYEKLKEQYDKKFWINRTKKMILQINSISHGLPKINVEKIINECQIKNEDYTIGTFFRSHQPYSKEEKRKRIYTSRDGFNVEYIIEKIF